MKTPKPPKTKKPDLEFFLSIRQPGRRPQKIFPGKKFTIGTDVDCDLMARDKTFSKSLTLLERRGKDQYTLCLPDGVSGELKKGDSHARLESLIKLGLIHTGKGGKFHTITITPGFSFDLTIGEFSISSGYKVKPPPPPKPPRAKIAHHIPFISGEERQFGMILAGSILLHLFLVLYLGTVEIIKPASSIEAIKKLDARFARLILKPKKKVAPPKVAEKPKEEEKKKEVEEEKPEEKLEEEKKPKRKMTEERKKVVKRVQKKGVLGVIGAKGGILAEFGGGSGIWSDVDDLIASSDVGVVGAGESLAEITGMQIASAEEIEAEGEFTERTEEEILKEKQEKASFKKKKRKSKKGKKQRNEAEVYMVVKRYVGGIKYIYNSALRRNSSLRGIFSVKVVISPEGKVKLVEVEKTTLGDEELEKAIVNRVYLWKFRPIPGSEDFAISYTFDFSPVG